MPPLTDGWWTATGTTATSVHFDERRASQTAATRMIIVVIAPEDIESLANQKNTLS